MMMVRSSVAYYLETGSGRSPFEARGPLGLPQAPRYKHVEEILYVRYSTEKQSP